jgi:hypothetical protein
MTSDLPVRLTALLHRLRTSYDGIGHSSGRPYVYVVYPPEQERRARRLADEELRSDAHLTFFHLDVLPVILQSVAGQEARRDTLLNDSIKATGTAQSLMRLWARAISRAMTTLLAPPAASGRPVIVLRGLAALHPLGTPTGLMEELAEQEPRDPATNRIVPIVLLIPGIRPPQTSRTYRFLGVDSLRSAFYRGEEA